MTRAALLAVALLLLGEDTLALNKCVSAEGRVSYSEQPCARGSKPATVRQATGPGATASPAGTRVDYYDVRGSDFGSLLAALNARGAHHGRADWKVSYRYRTRHGPGACQVDSLDTALELSMQLPRWSPPAGVSRELVSKWDRYLEALRVHEEGHLEHGRGMEQALKAALGGMSAANCGALDAAMRTRFSQLLEEYRARDREYDQRTGHGKTQGAYFN